MKKKRIKDMSTDELKLRLGNCLKISPKAKGKPVLELRGLSYQDALSKRKNA